MDRLPVNESLGVFLGVAGFDWLADGQADPVDALLAAIVAGGIIFAVRQMRDKQRTD
jgi:hypothetical protein